MMASSEDEDDESEEVGRVRRGRESKGVDGGVGKGKGCC